MSDIVERLRNVDLLDDFARLEAAAEIERLRRQDIDGLHSVRVAAIEECAQLADACEHKRLAAAIRALKEQKK